MNIIIHEANGLQIGQRHDDGYINLTKMAQANNKLIADYLRLDTTRDFLDELSLETGIPISKIIQIRKGRGDRVQQGTWGHPYVAINCGQWCSPKFAVLVSQWVVSWMTTAQNPIKFNETESELLKVSKAYIEGAQALNRVIHNAIHQQTDILRFALRTTNSHNATSLIKSQQVRQKDKVDKTIFAEASPKKNTHGSLYPFTQTKKGKQGIITYPKVKGERDPNNPNHWFWAYCWDEKDNKGKWRTRKRSVAREKLEDVRRAIATNKPIEKILKLL